MTGRQPHGAGQGHLRGCQLAATGARHHHLVRGAAGHQLPPGQEPDRPAVAPCAVERAAHDRDRVADPRMAVVPGRVPRGHVDAPVADVAEPLLGHRPWRAVHVVAAVGELHRVVDQHVVVAGHAAHHAVGRRVHAHRVAHGERQVMPVRGFVAGLARADRPVALQMAVPPHLHVMPGGAGHGHE